MPYTYPPAAPTLSGDILSASRFLNNPTLVARRLRTLLEQRFITSRLLSARFPVEGGAIVFETGESIYVADDPRPVAPLAAYPLTVSSTGTASVGVPVKVGEDSPISDEQIKRTRMDPVNRTMIKLANTNVKKVDSTGLSAIATAVTATQAAAASWATASAQQILTDVATAKANVMALNQGYDPDTVAVDDINFAIAFAKFLAAGFFSRESNNPLAGGQFPIVDGMTWLPTPNLPTAGKALIADSSMLGGWGVEDLGGPGYSTLNDMGSQSKVIRQDEVDGWLLRVRASNVPVIIEPASARFITGI
jgi:hypothetical protein